MVLRIHEDSVGDLAFDSKGQWLATLGANGKGRLWKLPWHGSEPLEWVPHPPLPGAKRSFLSTLAIDRTGRRLATVGHEGLMRIWDPAMPTNPPVTVNAHFEVPRFRRGYFSVRDVAFDASGRWVASAAEDGVKLWSLEELKTSNQMLRGEPSRRLGGVRHLIMDIKMPGFAPTEIALGPQGRWLAAYGLDGGTDVYKLSVWDLDASSSDAIPLIGAEDSNGVLAFDTQAKWLASSSRGGGLILWSLDRKEQPPMKLGTQGRLVRVIAFDPSGRWLAVGGEGGLAQLRLTTVMDQTKPLPGHTGTVQVMAFAPKGRWLVTGDNQTSIFLWDLKGDKPRSRALGGNIGLTGAAFDDHGRWLVTGNGDDRARLWNVEHPGPEVAVLQGGECVAIDPEGAWLITGGRDGTLRKWTVAIEPLIEEACRRADRNLTAAEWSRHFMDESQQPTCPSLPGFQQIAVPR